MVEEPRIYVAVQQDGRQLVVDGPLDLLEQLITVLLRWDRADTRRNKDETRRPDLCVPPAEQAKGTHNDSSQCGGRADRASRPD
jgi:hypothetical protein